MKIINASFIDKNNFHLFALCTIFLSFFTKLVLLSEPFGSDDLRYFAFARSLLLEGRFESLDHAASRIIYLALVGFPGVLAGNILFSQVASIIISSVTELLVAYYCFSRFSPAASFLALVFLAFNGVVLTFSGYLVPDPLLSLFWFLSVVILVYSFDANSSKRVWLLFVSGLFVGLAYSSKDTGVLVIPVSGLYILYRARALSFKTIFNLCLAFGFGALVVWLAESSILALLSGDFLYKLHALSHVHNQGDVNIATDVYNFITVGYWNFIRIVKWPAPLLIPVVLALISGIVMLKTKNKYSIFFIIFVFVFLYLCFGSSSFRQLINLPVQARYFQPLLPLVAVCIAASFSSVKNQLYRKGVLFLVVIVVFQGLIFSFRVTGNIFYQSYVHNAKLGAAALAENGYPVFVDCKASQALTIRYFSKVKDIVQPIPAVEPLPSGYYLFDPQTSCASAEVKEMIVSNAKYKIQFKEDSRPSILLKEGSQIKYPAIFHFFVASPEVVKDSVTDR